VKNHVKQQQQQQQQEKMCQLFVREINIRLMPLESIFSSRRGCHGKYFTLMRQEIPNRHILFPIFLIRYR